MGKKDTCAITLSRVAALRSVAIPIAACRPTRLGSRYAITGKNSRNAVAKQTGDLQVTSRLTAAIPMENSYCSYKLTRVRSSCRWRCAIRWRTEWRSPSPSPGAPPSRPAPPPPLQTQCHSRVGGCGKVGRDLVPARGASAPAEWPCHCRRSLSHHPWAHILLLLGVRVRVRVCFGAFIELRGLIRAIGCSGPPRIA